MPHHIIHIHIPAFSIAIMRVVQPKLRGRPVAVASPRSTRALILSVSPEAEREGVRKGMPLVKAVARCPDLTVINPDPGLVARANRELCRIAAWYTPIWEPFRPGHVYLDLTGTGRLWGEAKDTALRMRREIKDRLCLPGTAGVAANKMIAGIASRIVSPETVMDVPHGRESTFMAPLPVGVVPGIGRFRCHLLLEELNITRVGHLAALDLPSLAILFGRHAPVIHQRALGIDPTPVYPSPKKPIISEERTLSEDENDDHKLLCVLLTLVERSARRLRQKGLFPRKAGILIRYADQVEVRRQCCLDHPGSWDFELYGPMKELFFKACARRVRIRYIRIWFRDLFLQSRQLSLFDSPSHGHEKRVRLIQALDHIRERHGHKAIRYAGAT
ncbi:MAG: DNA polymerase IV [Deltaproteobacteria bacterium]|nr:DNA polymerase IV [Deltaproteobacteria bacterium]